MTHQIGIIGCGDYLRWMAGGVKASKRVTVKALFDPARERAAKYAAELGGEVAASADAIFADKAISIVCLFVPPWLRKELVIKAAAAGKHILATKPLAPSIEECDAILKAIEGKVRCAIMYGRSGDAMTELTKRVLSGGEVGKLALYKQDWLHHYPQWNNWALDPRKNGGPFMDAMIHNLNAVRYLMGRPMTAATLFSEKLAHPDMTCADTESLRASFAGGGVADLFITWAADLAVYSTDGNNREHIDIFYMITDKGWRLTRDKVDGKGALVASRDGQTRHWLPEAMATTQFDQFAEAVDSGGALPGNLVTPQMAAEDIKLLRTLEKRVGERVAVSI